MAHSSAPDTPPARSTPQRHPAEADLAAAGLAVPEAPEMTLDPGFCTALAPSTAGIPGTAVTPGSPVAPGSGPPDSVENAYRRCRELGLRLSKQRRMVLQLLWAEKTHLSARDIFEKLNNLGRNIGHTSVYQNLESLQAAGVIECLDRASGRLYGYRAEPHSHLTCLESGAIHDLDVALPPSLLEAIERQTGFLIEGYTLNLLGRRRPC